MTDQNEFNFEKPKSKIALSFQKYDANNPNVWRLFVQYSQQAAHAGRKTFSAQAIIERIRWFHSVENPDDDFKINNDSTLIGPPNPLYHERTKIKGTFK